MEQTPFIIKANSQASFAFAELWKQRELLYFFTWRDIKVKYKQTLLGFLWVLLQPLGMMLIFTLLFSKVLNTNLPDDLPYPVFVLSGIILWNLFYSSVSHAADSMVVNAHIIRKVYFPRLIIPLSSIAASLLDFIIASGIFLIVAFIYGVNISALVFFYFPAALGICLLSCFGLGSLLSALNLKFRDFRYALPFLLQLLFFGSQIIYSIEIVEKGWFRYLLAINPMNAAIELLRAGLSNHPPDMVIVSIGSAFSIILMLSGLIYFKKTENYFADIA